MIELANLKGTPLSRHQVFCVYNFLYFCTFNLETVFLNLDGQALFRRKFYFRNVFFLIDIASVETETNDVR